MDAILTLILSIVLMGTAAIFLWLFLHTGKKVSENTDSIREKKPPQKEGNTSSVIGRTKTDITQYSTVLPNNPAPVKDVDNSDNFTGEENEFFPDIDEVDEEEVELEELFEVTKDDIRLNGTELISKEISLLKKVGSNDSIEEEEKAEVSETISKLQGSDFLKLLKENEAKAEKRNQELMRMIEEEELKSPKPVRKKKNKPEEISLEDFL